GSQGEQRLALLALLLAERTVLHRERGRPPLILLDDVMSELDADRRALLVERLSDGQSLITTTELAHVPGAERADVTRIAVFCGTLARVGVRPLKRCRFAAISAVSAAEIPGGALLYLRQLDYPALRQVLPTLTRGVLT